MNWKLIEKGVKKAIDDYVGPDELDREDLLNYVMEYMKEEMEEADEIFPDCPACGFQESRDDPAEPSACPRCETKFMAIPKSWSHEDVMGHLSDVVEDHAVYPLPSEDLPYFTVLTPETISKKSKGIGNGAYVLVPKDWLFGNVRAYLHPTDQQVTGGPHLCQSCGEDFAECDGDPEFGDGYGNDNVVDCDSYYLDGDKIKAAVEDDQADGEDHG